MQHEPSAEQCELKVSKPTYAALAQELSYKKKQP